MKVIGLTTPDFGTTPAVGPLFRTARIAILALLAAIYGGSLDFFILLSPVLLYGTYLVILGSVSVCLFYDWSATRHARSVAPYLAWVFVYILWGLLAISSEENIITEGVKCYIKNVLLIGGMALALDRRSLRPFAQMVQVVMLANFALCVWEFFNPSLNGLIALTRDPKATAYDLLRPAGLWCNPDEAATAYLFALLMGRWAGRPLALIGPVAAVLGIFLTASRTGAYLLVIFGLVYAVWWLRTARLRSAHLAVLFAGLLLAGAGAGGMVKFFDFVPSERWQFGRLLDVSEAEASAKGGSRRHIAQTAIATTLKGPWYGWGLFTFQFHAQPIIKTVLDPPSHNIYLAVWGEAGAPVALSYLVILGVGVWRVLRLSMLAEDRIALLLMWFGYLVVGLTWHNQFTAFLGMIFAGLLWRLPDVVADSFAEQEEIFA
ncbi:MAG: O-antigen ligase family protein [Chthoniobacter sp.]|nr:O-antigen ligase family protein [Chthoniobacter sp.]